MKVLKRVVTEKVLTEEEKAEQKKIYENYKTTQIPDKNLKMLAGLFAIYHVSYQELHEILHVIHCYKADARKLDEMTQAGISSEMLEKLLPGLVQPSGSTISIKKVKLGETDS